MENFFELEVYLIDVDIDITNHLSLQKNELNANNVYIFNSNAFNFLENLKENFNVIFLDPPFSKKIINEIIRKISLMPEISDKCKIYIELPYKKNNEFIINNKDRIAQMILMPIVKMDLQESDSLPDSVRGEGGFGSTGK